jgi:aspartate/methionine/tyrosine aminotransferase
VSLLAPFLSDRGRAARMPEGIRVWGERAARAGALDATMGVITAPLSLLGGAEPRDAAQGVTGAGGGSSGAAEAYGIASLPQIRAAFAAWDPREVFPYAPVAGTRSFREGWRRWIGMKAAGDFTRPGPLEERLTLPVATAGVSGALGAVGHLVLDPGDPVLVPDRRWDGYDTTFGTVNGARVVSVRLLDGPGWDLGALREAMVGAARERGRAVCVINFPHNPTGYAPSEEEAESFARLAADVAEETGGAVIVLCDDAYEGYVYADRPRTSIFYRLVDRHPRLLPIKCDGITKELLFWGGRLGAVTTAFRGRGIGECAAMEREWENKLSAVVRGMISSASTPVQTLVARLLADPGALIEARAPLVRSLAERHAAFGRALDSAPAREAFRPDPFHGGLFALLNLVRGDAVEAARFLLSGPRIGVVPFGGSGADLNALRVTYATVPIERIEELVAEAAKATLESGS